MNKLNSFLKKYNLKINYVDVGARDDISPLLKSFNDNIKIIGFEVDPEERNKLKEKFPDRKYYDFGLWSKKQQLDLYLTIDPGCSSIYKPNFEANSKFKDIFHSPRNLNKIIPISCNTLDSIDEPEIDFIKIDTQGAEYEILKGAKKVLSSNIPLISCETWTTEVYQNVPLMHKVIEIMYDYGYELLDMELCHSAKHKNNNKSISKAISGGYEILFYKKNINSNINQNLLIKHILLLDLFGYKDLANHIFNVQKINNDDLERYLIKNSSLTNNKKVFIKKGLSILYNKFIGSTYLKMSD